MSGSATLDATVVAGEWRAFLRARCVISATPGQGYRKARNSSQMARQGEVKEAPFEQIFFIRSRLTAPA
jgi:hypothetical protein